MEKELTYEEIEYGHTIYEPDEMKFESTDELDEILRSEEEIKTNLEKARTWKDLFGWKHTLDQDIRYDVDTEDYDNEEE